MSLRLKGKLALAAAGLAAALILAPVGIRLWPRRQGEPARPAELAATRGGRAIRPDLLIDVPLYKQWGPAWADDELGATGAKMREVGCLVCCVAMTFTHYGIRTTPKELNDYLGAHAGYTRKAWLRWQPSAAFTGGRAALAYRGAPDRARIDACLAAGEPAIVKVKLSGGIPHWVLVVGKAGEEYLVNDPLGPEPHPIRLSRFGGRMHAMRLLRKTRH